VSSSAGNLSQRITRGFWVQVLMPRIEDILFIAIFLAVMAMGPRLMNMDGDLGRHLTIGKYILENGSIPIRDIFSHTMQGITLTPHEWLAQVTFALSFNVAGLNGVVIQSALLIALTFTIVYRQCFEQGRILLLSLGMTVLAAAAASIHWLTRPHLFTMLFAVLWIRELENWRKTGRWRWWLLPLLMLLWVNFHGAFIVGILLWAIYLIDHLFSRWNQKKSDELELTNVNNKIETSTFLLIGLAVLLATFLNPVGWHIWETTLGFLQNRYLVSHTVEYQSPNFQEISTWPFLGMICLSILLLGLRRGKLHLIAVLLLISWTAFGLISARNIAIYAVIAAPVLAGIGAIIIRENRNSKNLLVFDQKLMNVDRNLFGYLWPLLSVIVIGVLTANGMKFNSSGLGNNFSSNVFPVEAVDWILEQPEQGRVFNYFPWGGYLLYRAWPRQRVFIDGQTDFYGEDLTRKYERVITLGDGWEDILAEYHVDWVIMPTESDLSKELVDHPKWERQYLDQTASVFYVMP
jgi:hypothetical protein